MTGVTRRFDWTGPSSDANDEQFGDVIEQCSIGSQAESGDVIEQTDIDAASDYDAVLLGEPFDRAVIGRKGAAEGPSALREALAGVKTHHFDFGPVARVGDAGDVNDVESDDPLEVSVERLQVEVRDVAARLHDADTLPVFLGGDNSLTYPNAAPLLESGSLGVLNFDAHLDVREVGDDPTSGTPYRQLFADGLDAYACVGARHFETSTTYADFVREQGDNGEIVTAEEVGEDPVAAIDTALSAMDGVDAVYVSVDLDVLDAAHAPGVSAPTPGGLSTRELFRALRLAASDDRVRGFEVVECAPPLDEGERTARAGARAVAHFLAAVGGSGNGSAANGSGASGNATNGGER